MEETSPDSGQPGVATLPTDIHSISPPTKAMSGAITAVMTEVQHLEQTATNPQGGYKFASIDGFLDMVRPLMAKHGLGLVWQERKFELIPPEERGKKGWLAIRMDFYITLDDTIWGPFSRTIMCMMMGAQSFGSAQSYGIKQFLRAQFMISTGDKEDADFNPTGQAPTGRGRSEAQKPPKQAKEPQKTDPTKPSKQQFNYMMKLWTGHEKHPEHPIEPALLKEWSQRRFGIKSRTELTKAQMSDLIEVLTRQNPHDELQAYVTHARAKEKPPPDGEKF